MSVPYMKLEIDVMQISELNDATTITYQNNLPAIIIHPNLITDALIARGKIRGKYKLIVPIDWPKGELVSTDKIKGLSFDALEADGFEIMLSYKDGPTTAKETHELTNFIKGHLSPQAEVRFVLGATTKTSEELASMCECLQYIRNPFLLRTDSTLKVKINKPNEDVHSNTISIIRKYVSTPIKVSGNITNIRSIATYPNAFRFAVNVAQAKAIIDEHHLQPSKLWDILNSENTSNEPLNDIINEVKLT